MVSRLNLTNLVGSQLKLITMLTLLITFSLPCLSQADDLSKYRDKANSDDAETIEEAFFHSNARALVIRKIEPNKLSVGGKEFRIKRNPLGKGCFVYDPRTRFSGVKRNLVWFVLGEDAAYALNAPSKMVTPVLKWPREDGIHTPSTSEVIAYVFDKKPMTSPKSKQQGVPSSDNGFTIEEYKIYRAVIDSPMSVSEAEAVQKVAKNRRIEAAEAKKTVDKVQGILFENK